MCKQYFLLFVGTRRRLKDGAIPSVFTFTPQPSTSVTARRERRRKQFEKDSIIHDIGNDVVIDSESSTPETHDVLSLEDDTQEAEVQCELLTDRNTSVSVKEYETKPIGLQYYTGFDDYMHFMLLFNILGPATSHLFKATHHIGTSRSAFYDIDETQTS